MSDIMGDALDRLYDSAKCDKESAQYNITRCRHDIVELEKQIMQYTGERDHADSVMIEIQNEMRYRDGNK